MPGRRARPRPSSAAAPALDAAAHAAVASDHPLASAAGVAALKAGGNAVDAACATALALGVLHPESSGIGGGAFAVVYIAKDRKAYALDARERAPAAIDRRRLHEGRHAVAELSQRGGLAVAVPGEVRGLGEMVRRWGALPFRRCVEPAQRLAARGFPVSSRLAKSLAGLDRAGGARQPAATPIASSRCSRASRCAEGDTWRRPDLAWTLGKLRAGPDAFYKGEIAKEIVTRRARRRAACSRRRISRATRPSIGRRSRPRYRGLRVLSMPPSSSGGVALIETLGILAARYPAGIAAAGETRGSAAQLHVLAEAFKHAFADRARYLGDTDFVTVDLAHLTSPAYHAELAAADQAGRGAAARRLRDIDVGAAARAAQGRAGRRTCR